MWKNLENVLKNKEYFQQLTSFLDAEYDNFNIFPPKESIFRCFDFFDEKDLKVVIIGQDPYHEINQANGLSFSVNSGVKLPPSLRNIYKEIEIEYNKPVINKDGDFSYYASQGVLFLNKYLTVREGKPLSHKCKEYELLFEDIISYINSLNQPIVYLLWGDEAKKVKKLINNPLHLILETNHPSPLSANRGGWFNSMCFIKCNDYLSIYKIHKVDWLKERE